MTDETARTLATIGVAVLFAVSVGVGYVLALLAGWPLRRLRWTRAPGRAAALGALASWVAFIVLTASTDDPALAASLRMAGSASVIPAFLLALRRYRSEDEQAAPTVTAHR